MNTRPSKRRRLSPVPAQSSAWEAQKSHTDGASASEDGSDASGSDNGEMTSDSASRRDTEESEFEDFDSQPSFGNSDSVNNRPSSHELEDSADARKPNGRGVAGATKNRAIGRAAGVMTRALFEVQVNDLLRQVKPRLAGQETVVESTLRLIKSTIEALADIAPEPIDVAERKLLQSSKTAVPWPGPRPSPDAKYTVAFGKPSYINVVGSYAMNTASDLDGALQIDLVCQMPSSLFTTKDYLNNRYFHKRAYYLACIAAGLSKSNKLKAEFEYSNLNGSYLTPIIVSTPKGDDAKNLDGKLKGRNWRVRIMLAVDSAFFPRNKTLPDKNCVRPAAVVGGEEHESFPPTPFYNGALRADSSVLMFLKLFHSTASKCAGFRDACYLGRIWVRQRGLGSLIQQGGFGNFEWASMMALLLQAGGRNGGPALEATLGSQHLFNSMVNFLAARNLAKHPLQIDNEPEDNKILWATDNPILFYGKAGLNILFKMTPWSYKFLQQEAQATARILGRKNAAKFDSIFILRIFEPFHCYDLTAKVSLDGVSQNQLSDSLQELYHTLDKGLADRVSLISIDWPTNEPWPLNKAPPTSVTTKSVIVGIRIDASNAGRAVERGPSVEDAKAAATFREFWGDKAELRRFKDGQILESVVWNGKDAYAVTKEIISFLIQTKFNGKMGKSIEFIGNRFDRLSKKFQQPTTSVDYQSAFSILESQIRSLERFPLQIRQIQESGVQLGATRSANKSFDGTNQISQVIVQFEGSGRWPDDLTAVQMTKLAFLLKMSQLLADSSGVLHCRVGVENEASTFLNKSFLDIYYASGAVFRIRIHHDREQALLETRLADRTLLPRQREETARALSIYKRDFVRAPLYAQAMQKLITRFPALSDSIRLVRAWFNAHLLSNHVAPRIIDVLTARTFLDPQPWPTPSSAQAGFFRTLLFLSRWDWQNDPFIVDFGGEGIKPDEYSAIHTRFEAWRQIDPLMNRVAMFVATDFDPEGTTWTEYSPAKVVAARIKSLAAAASRLVKDKGLDLDIASLFKSRISEYDFVLKLDPSYVERRQEQNGKPRYKNLQQMATVDAQDIGFDPVELFLEELQAVFGDSAVFFYGQGEEVIAGLWSPHTAPRTWKVNIGYSTVPIPDDNLGKQEQQGLTVAINKTGMLADMARLGSDLIVGVEMIR